MAQSHNEQVLLSQQEHVLRAHGRLARSTEQEREKQRIKLPAVAAVTTIAAVAATAAATTTAIATVIASSATSVAPATTAPTRSFGLRAGFVDNEVPATEVLTVEAIDGAIRIFIVGNFDEGEAARLACEAVTNKTDCRRANSQLTKPLLQLLFRCTERKITHVELLHLQTPSARN